MRSELEALAATFDALTLAELDERARLQTRIDRKYVVGPDVFRRLVEPLATGYRALELEGRRLFRYDSIYFDTPSLTTYRQHQQGRRKRFKCRTRLYETGLCFFEVKLKDGRGQTVKRQLPINPHEHGRLTADAHRFLVEQLQRSYGQPAPGAFAPALRTVYGRVTLVCREGRERVTCDTGLVFSAPGSSRSRLLPGRVLIETKSERGNTAADRLLRRLGARPVSSCSKYCVGTALSRSDVVDNRFRLLVRRHFEACAVPAALAA